MEALNVEPVQSMAKKALSKSMNKILPAGGISKRAIEMNQQDREAQMRIRTYKAEDDLNREFEYRDAISRIVRASVTNFSYTGLRVQTCLQ